MTTVGGSGGSGAAEDQAALPLDLGTLLKVLDNHKKDTTEEPAYSTWQLVLIQGLLLSILVVLSICWACCCKKRCFHAAPPSVQEALRKLSTSSSKSRDFPPSYSQADLHTLATSVYDYLYPPPQYPDVFNRSADELAYLDLEAGHQRLARLSFCGNSPVIPPIPPLSRQSSSISSGSFSRRSSLGQDGTRSRRNSILKESPSRKSSSSQDSRRSSRISFSEAVECSNGSFRRLSGSQGPSPAELSRKSSSSSPSSADGSRRSSLLLNRKMGLSQESLDQELRKRLESIEAEEERISALETIGEEKGTVPLDTVVEDGAQEDGAQEDGDKLETVAEVEEVKERGDEEDKKEPLETAVEID